MSLFFKPWSSALQVSLPHLMGEQFTALHPTGNVRWEVLKASLASEGKGETVVSASDCRRSLFRHVPLGLFSAQPPYRMPQTNILPAPMSAVGEMDVANILGISGGHRTQPVQRAGPSSPSSAVSPFADVSALIERWLERGMTSGLIKSVFEDLPFGRVVKRYHPEFQTDLYFTVSAATQMDGDFFAMVPEGAKAILIYFHGGGSEHAYGGNLWQEMNLLSQHGVASVGFDLPFHRSGPREESLRSIDAFMAWVDPIVRHFVQAYPDKKIILVGHSFGPAVILEYLGRHPTQADGAILLSPANRFSERMEDHYRNQVLGILERNRDAWGLVLNEEGDSWEDGISDQWTYMHREPPSIPLWAIVGEQDQWFPDMEEAKVLAAHFPTMDLSVVPGMDHFVFAHIVQKMDPDVQEKVFREMPPGSQTRFVIWTVIDFLRRHFGEIVPLSPDRNLKKLSPVQQALLLYELNPYFRELVFNKDILLDPSQAEMALNRWEELKYQMMQRIFATVPKEHPDFYKDFQGDWDAISHILQLGKKLAGENKNRSEVLVAKFVRHLASLEEKGEAAPLPLVAPPPAETNQWREQLAGIYSSMKQQFEIRARQVSLLRSAYYRLRGLTPDLVHLLHDTAVADTLDLRERQLSRMRDTLNRPANNVLVIGNGEELLVPFRLFDRTERLVVLSENRFGTPEEIGRDLTLDRLQDVQRRAAASNEEGTWFFRDRRDRRVGANFLLRVSEGLRAREILGLYYFRLNSDGKKEYGNGFEHAEIRFVDLDGREKSVEVLHVDFQKVPKEMVHYLDQTPLEAVFGGVGTTKLEENPEAVFFYAQFLQRRRIPWVSGDRLVEYMGALALHERIPPVFLNGDTIERYDFEELNGLYGHSFTRGNNIYVARSSDFLSYWKPEATWEYRTRVNEDRMFEKRTRL